MNLKPCPYRHVGDEGHILCDKIKSGDREVSPNICRVCPVSQINCAHLRATLDHQAHPPVIVRWGNGKTETWEDDAPSIRFIHSACAEKVIPIHSPRDCAGCTLRLPLVTQENIGLASSVDRRFAPPVIGAATKPLRPAKPSHLVPAITAESVQPTPSAEVRSNIVAEKLSKLQEWLNRQKPSHRSIQETPAPTPIIQSASANRTLGEEKRAGWTD